MRKDRAGACLQGGGAGRDTSLTLTLSAAESARGSSSLMDIHREITESEL